MPTRWCGISSVESKVGAEGKQAGRRADRQTDTYADEGGFKFSLRKCLQANFDGAHSRGQENLGGSGCGCGRGRGRGCGRWRELLLSRCCRGYSEGLGSFWFLECFARVCSEKNERGECSQNHLGLSWLVSQRREIERGILEQVLISSPARSSQIY